MDFHPEIWSLAQTSFVEWKPGQELLGYDEPIFAMSTIIAWQIGFPCCEPVSFLLQ
jgi:hypothetical protein